MEMSQGIAIVLGVIIIGGIIYAVVSNSDSGSSHVNSGNNSNSTLGLKPLDDLIKNQVVLDTLNASYIVNWFKNNNQLDSSSNVVRMLAYPTKTVLNGFGYEFNPQVDMKTNAIICYANQETGKLLKYQWIAFKEMDNNIKSMFQSGDDFVIFDD